MTIRTRTQTNSEITHTSIAEQILKEWSAEDLAFLKSGQYDFGMCARAIRNDYGLWEFDHPLTKLWHQYPELRDITGSGIDISEDHPDAVSTTILNLVKARL